jgi:1-deoxy-D-xylulose-5-phosphate reductoisomerase
MDDAHSAELLRAKLREQGSRTEVMSGQQAAAEVAALDEVEQVMAAIVGAAGLVPTLQPFVRVKRCCWRTKSRW